MAAVRSGIGYTSPDGHGNRAAVGADAYYADMDGVWSDTGNNLNQYAAGINRDNAITDGSINLAGDNKFDPTQLSEMTWRPPVFNWAVISRSLPPGLALDSSGNITGLATAGGTYAFTVQVTDQAGLTATKALSLTAESNNTTTWECRAAFCTECHCHRRRPERTT